MTGPTTGNELTICAATWENRALPSTEVECEETNDAWYEMSKYARQARKDQY